MERIPVYLKEYVPGNIDAVMLHLSLTSSTDFSLSG